MADTSKIVDVALIDEYQLISDPKRGWAWSRALLGLPAREIHLTGSAHFQLLFIRFTALSTSTFYEVPHRPQLAGVPS